MASIARGGSGFGWALRLAVAIVVGLTPALHAQQPEFIDREPEIKAAYLYNFARYVEWPDAGTGEFVIGVVGETRVAAPLATIASTKKINRRSIVVRRFKTVKDFQHCHLLFIPADQDAKLVEAALKNVAKTPTLIVGEAPEFAVRQGHIGFYAEQNSVKFTINSGSAEKIGLKISSKLLSLGRIVGERPR